MKLGLWLLLTVWPSSALWANPLFVIHIADQPAQKVQAELESGIFIEDTREMHSGYMVLLKPTRETMLEVNDWTLRIYNGENLVFSQETVLGNEISITRKSGEPNRLQLRPKLAKEIRAQLKSTKSLRAMLVPMTWLTIPEAEQQAKSVTLAPNVRGQFLLTHTRLSTFEPMLLSEAQTRDLLHLPEANILSQCFASLLGR